MFFVPVVDQNNDPLMPTQLLRARRWIASGKATPFYKKGVFCVRLNVAPSDNKNQDIALTLDPGGKREGYTIKSAAHTYANPLTGTVDWVKDSMKQRKIMCRSRRQRKTRYREARSNNRKKKKLPPSVKARWQFKLNVAKTLFKLYPITVSAVEDIKAETKKNCKKWNKSFSPLEVGKKWFYAELQQLAPLYLKEGWETKELRDALGLKKSSSKLSDKFECHNVDSWVLANWLVGGHTKPDNKSIIKFVPIRIHRRQLHVLQFAKGGIRKNYGGSRSMCFKRDSLIKHKKYGLVYVGGSSKGRISVIRLSDGKRLSQKVKIDDCVFRTFLSFRTVN